MNNSCATATTADLTPAERSSVAALASRMGDRAAAAALGIEISTFLRILARRTIRRGTVLLVRAALATLATEERAATS